MAYNFKNLADVELLNIMPEEANVVVEVNGTTKRAPQVEVDVTAELVGTEALEEVPEGATVLAEVNGQIKRVPSAGLGGAGIKTAIIKDSLYDNALAGVQAAESIDITHECINMTFEEAYETLANGEPMSAMLMVAIDMPSIVPGMISFCGTAVFGIPTIVIGEFSGDIILFWTADGFLTSPPSSGEEN